MEEIIRKIRLHHLKAIIEVSRLHGEALAKEFNKATTNEEKTRIAHEWKNAIRAKNSAKIILDRLEHPDPPCSPTTSAARAN